MQEVNGVVGGGVGERNFLNKVGVCVIEFEQRGEMEQGLVFDGLYLYWLL